MAVDILLPYGGDASWTPQGQPVLVVDVPGNPAATAQQVTGLCMQSPRLKNGNGVAIGRADNLFYPDRGGGINSVVGSNAQPLDINTMTTNIISCLATKPTIAPLPIPTVKTNNTNNGALVVVASCQTTDGEQITISSAPSTSSGG